VLVAHTADGREAFALEQRDPVVPDPDAHGYMTAWLRLLGEAGLTPAP
jgi:hypothetical protein